MEESLVYMKLSEASLIYIKGTTLYTKKEYYKTNSRMGKKNEHLQQRLGSSSIAKARKNSWSRTLIHFYSLHD